MADYEMLTVEHRDRVAVITFNRPDAANGLNPQMAREFAEAAARIDHDPSIKAVVLTGSGRFFSAGGDVKSMAEFGDERGARIKALADDLHRAISTLARMSAPVIVAVNGVAAGAGFSMAIMGDLVVASSSAVFTMSYTGVGLSPDGSSSYYLPRLVGLRRAQELMLTNRKLTAAEALDWGLVTKVVEPEALLDEALALAGVFTRGAAGSNAAVKTLLLATFTSTLETQMELEGRLIAGCAASPDGAEGIGAFVEKRAPNFS